MRARSKIDTDVFFCSFARLSSSAKVRGEGVHAKTTTTSTKKFLSANTCFSILLHLKQQDASFFPCVFCTTRPWRGNELQKRRERVCGVTHSLKEGRRRRGLSSKHLLLKEHQRSKEKGEKRRGVSVGKGALASSRTKMQKRIEARVFGIGINAKRRRWESREPREPNIFLRVRKFEKE